MTSESQVISHDRTVNPMVSMVESGWKYTMDIYFLRVNTKYISSRVVKNQHFAQVRSTSENDDIFTERDKIYLLFTSKNLYLFYTQRNIEKSQPNFIHVHVSGRFLFDLVFSVCLLGITLCVN